MLFRISPAMRLEHAVALLSCAITPLLAQSVTTSVTALVPLHVQVSSGLNVAQATQPAGLLPAAGQVSAVLSVTDVASASWSSLAQSTEVLVLLRQALTVAPASAVGAAATGHEFLVEFAAVGGQVPAILEIRRQSEISQGLPASTVAIDLHNDGTIDLVDPGTFFMAPQVIAGQPLRVRVIMSSFLSTSGGSLTDVHLTLRPANDLIVLQSALACGFGSGALDSARLDPPVAVFADRGMDATIVSSGALAVYVVGLTQQPLLLPPSGLVPCLLVPSTDVVLFQLAPLHLALPAAVRPLTFHLQAVALTSVGLQTTDGYTVIAN